MWGCRPRFEQVCARTGTNRISRKTPRPHREEFEAKVRCHNSGHPIRHGRPRRLLHIHKPSRPDKYDVIERNFFRHAMLNVAGRERSSAGIEVVRRHYRIQPFERQDSRRHCRRPGRVGLVRGVGAARRRASIHERHSDRVSMAVPRLLFDKQLRATDEYLGRRPLERLGLGERLLLQQIGRGQPFHGPDPD